MEQKNVPENKKKIVQKIRLIKVKLIANQKRYNKHSTHRQTVTVIILLVFSKQFFFVFRTGVSTVVPLKCVECVERFYLLSLPVSVSLSIVCLSHFLSESQGAAGRCSPLPGSAAGCGFLAARPNAVWLQ